MGGRASQWAVMGIAVGAVAALAVASARLYRNLGSALLMRELHEWLSATLRRLPGESALVGVVRYSLSRWGAHVLPLRMGEPAWTTTAPNALSGRWLARA